MPSSITIIQITDLHILAEPNKTMAGVNTEKTFQQIVEHIHKTYPSIDLLLVTGDLAQDPCRLSYQKIFETLKKYPTRTICLPGNHDDFNLMQQIIANKQINCDKRVQFKNWQVISLNSKKPGTTGGFINSSELIFLANMLESNPTLYTLIAMHHHPIPTNSVWMDTMTIENSHELFAIINHYPQVKALCYGHIHQETETIKDNRLILGTPSTCFQFKPLSINYAIDNNKPGYRALTLYANGSVESSVFRL
ncbi:MAG: 3',5'-cyclic-AMP phosphodiesterase [Methylococcales bacterium]